MNKQLLLQSIKTVVTFLVVISIFFILIGFVLSKIPLWAGTILSIIGLGAFLVWLEYKNLKDITAHRRLKK